jgi:two-component system alkaline phosphatase synthesis response regulator PhoP
MYVKTTDLLNVFNGEKPYYTKEEILKIINENAGIKSRPDVMYKNIIVKPQNYSVVNTDTNVETTLTKMMLEVLYYMVNRPGVIIKRDTLLDRLWGSDVIVTDRTVDVHICKLNKITNKLIKSYKRVGYIIE